MAQFNITLNQDEILQLLSNDRDEAFKKILQESLNSILKAESAEQLNAEKYERSEQRTDSRNGTRERPLTTRIGKIILTVPRHRNVPFKTLIFENYKRSEASLVATMAEMVVAGVSTRKVSKVIETLCGTSYSKSMVSEVCKDLDMTVREFKNRALTDSYAFLEVDATYLKARENHRIVSKAFMVAYATNIYGFKEVVGFDVFDNESNETWLSFFEGLKRRGLHGIKMITSDAHPGIQYAISKTYPLVPWQRCQTHFSRNILDKTPQKLRIGLQGELSEMYNAGTIEKAREIRNRIIEDYSDVAPAAMECLDLGFDSVMTVMVLPAKVRRYHRTTNHIERLNRELKRRSNVIGIFPNAESIERILGSVLMEYQDKSSRTTGYPVGALSELDVCVAELQKIAIEQVRLLAA